MRALYGLVSVSGVLHICASRSARGLLLRQAAYLTSLPPNHRVLFSPHAENIVASCSYDMTVRLWDVAAPQDALLRVRGFARLQSLHPEGLRHMLQGLLRRFPSAHARRSLLAC